MKEIYKIGKLTLRHFDEPPFTRTFERWARAASEWPDREQLDEAMRVWRAVDARYRAEPLFGPGSLDLWLAKCRREAHRVLLRYRRARDLSLNEWRINLTEVPLRVPDKRGWTMMVPIDRLWATEPEVITSFYAITPEQYGLLTVHATDVERHYRAWHELHGGIPEPSPVNTGPAEEFEFDPIDYA